MSTDPMKRQQQPKQSDNEGQLIGESLGKVFQSGLKVNRPTKIIFKDDNTKEILRNAKSGSVKQKLNLQNTKLKINIQNMSTLITIHEQNQARLKVELDRYKEKLSKYKQKIKQKDNIIVKLLQKLQKRIELDGKNLENLILKLHEQQIKNFKQKIQKGQQIDAKDVLNKYQQLLKGFIDQQRDKVYLEKQKEDLQKTVLELRETIKYIGDGNQSKKQKETLQLKMRLSQAESLLEKQKLARDQLLQSITNANIEIVPQLKTTIRQIQKQRYLTSKNNQGGIVQSSTQQISNLKKKLAQNQTNLFNQRETQKRNEKKYLNIQQQFSKLSQKFVISNSNLQNLQLEIENLQAKYGKQIKQLQQKFQVILQDTDNIEKHKLEVEDISKKFEQTILNFSQQATKWAMLENNYQNKIDQLRQNKRFMEDKLQKQTQKRRIFQLKLISYDQQSKDITKATPQNQKKDQQQSPEQKQVDLQRRLDYMRKQSLTNKKQNQSLNQQLLKQKRTHDLLQKQINYAQERIFQLQQILKKQSLGNLLKTVDQHIIGSPKAQDYQPPQQLTNQQIKERTHKDTANDNLQQLQQKLIQQKIRNNYLEIQVNELRNKNIQIQMNFEQVKKDNELKGSQNIQMYQKLKKKENEAKRGGITSSGKILQKGQKYVQKSDIQGDYQVNIFNVNEIPPQIQKLSFEELAIKYQAAKDEVLYLKQKIGQTLRSDKKIQRQSFKSGSSIPQIKPYQVLDEKNEQQQNSQDIDDVVYKNINEQMDRLIAKNKELQKQLTDMEIQFDNRFSIQQNLNRELRQKLKSSEEVNGNLSNIVIHLQNQLSKYQNNLDVSGQGQRGSQIMDYSAKRSEDLVPQQSNILNKQIMQKRKQFDDMLKSGDQQSDKQIGNRQIALKNLQLEIRQLQLKFQQQKAKQNATKSKIPQKLGSQVQCPNCQAITKINADLIRKISKQEETKQYKNTAVQKQLQELDKQLRMSIAANPQNLDTLIKQNKKLKQMLAEIKVQLNFQKKEDEDKENQIKNLKQVNQELISSIHQKQKMLLKLRTQSYRQTYQKQGIDEDGARKIDNILQSYERKIDELENIIKGQEKNQVSVTDLYDTINYLNNQCEILKKQNQDIAKQSSKDVLRLPQVLVQVPKTHEQLAKKYKQVSQSLGGLQKLAEDQNFKSINEMLMNNNELKERNLALMKQNNKLQNKIFSINAKTEQYFKKLNEGKTYQIIQEKQNQLQGLRADNEKLKQQIQNSIKDKLIIYAQNQKISQDLKKIEQHIQKLTGDKYSPQQSTITVDRTGVSKGLQRTHTGQLSNMGIQKQMQGLPFNQHAYALENIRKRLQKFKNSIQNSSHKTRPNYQIQSFRELPVLEDTIIILLDRLHFVWNLVQERTSQYNELRDQMNIISMECMKGAQTENNQMSKSRESEDKRQAQIIEERYQQVLAELIEYQNQNKRLEKEVNRLKQQVAIYKKQIQEVQSKYISQLRSQSSEEAPYNQQLLNKLLESGSGTVTVPVQRQMPEIIRLFLGRIKQLESHLESIQTEFDQKNQKLQSIIQKQKSFISEKSKVRGSDDSASSLKRQIQTEREKVDPRQQLIGSSSVAVVSPGGIMDEKSYFSLNSARVFKQIQELTRLNQELKDKKYKYRNMLDSVSKSIQMVINKLGNSLSQELKDQLTKFLNAVNQQAQQDSKKDNSGFDLEGDYILSSSFAQKSKQNAKLESQGLDQIKKTLQSPRTNEANQRLKKNNEQLEKKIQKNMKFLDQNKFLLDELLQKVNKQAKPDQQADSIKRKMAAKFTDKQIQQILYLTDPQQATLKIISILSQPQKQEKRVKFQNIQSIQTQNLQHQAEQQQHSQSIQQGEWVQTQQLQAIINQIYPTKTQLCIIVANSINMLMLAQTKQGILKAVQFLFSSLKKKEIQIKQQIKKRDESVNQYGRKLQKLLQSKFSQQQSQNKSQILNENSLRKTTQFKSQYLIKKQDGDNSFNQSHSQSMSGFLEK